MDDTRISQLTFAEPLLGNEFIPIIQYTSTISAHETVYTSPSALAGYIVGDAIDALYPTGAVIPYAGALSANDIPSGWLLCDGRSVSTSEYPRLYACISSMYGTAISGMFTLPNLKGRTIIGYESTEKDVNFNTVEPSWPKTRNAAVGSANGKFYHKINASELTTRPSSFGIPTVDSTSTVILPPPVIQQIYARGPEQGTWIDELNLSVYGSVPSGLSLRINFTQCEVRITNGGSWQLVGSTGSNNSIDKQVSVRPDAYGKIYVHVIDRNWGAHTLAVYAIIGQTTVMIPPATYESSIVTASNDNAAFSVMQPYILMNYIIKY
jgi:microcystin-dependent protein